MELQAFMMLFFKNFLFLQLVPTRFMRHIKGSLERTSILPQEESARLTQAEKNGNQRQMWGRRDPDVQIPVRVFPEEKSRAGGRRRGAGLAPGGQLKPLKSQESYYYRKSSS